MSAKAAFVYLGSTAKIKGSQCGITEFDGVCVSAGLCNNTAGVRGQFQPPPPPPAPHRPPTEQLQDPHHQGIPVRHCSARAAIVVKTSKLTGSPIPKWMLYIWHTFMMIWQVTGLTEMLRLTHDMLVKLKQTVCRTCTLLTPIVLNGPLCTKRHKHCAFSNVRAQKTTNIWLLSCLGSQWPRLMDAQKSEMI